MVLALGAYEQPLLQPESGGVSLTEPNTLESFLKASERRGFKMAEIATGNRDDALDILQDAMCKLVEKYSDRDASEWGPLFTRILQSRILDWYRRNSVRNRFRVWFSQGSGEQQPDLIETAKDNQSKTPEQLLGEERSLDLLAVAIRQLPIRQQQAFMLRTFEGLDVAATASAMNCSSGSVKTHYSRATHKLRQALKDDWGESMV